MQPSGNSVRHNGTGWSSALSRAAAAILLFELISGLAITFGPFNPSTQWGLLVHTVVCVLTVALLVWYVVRHCQTYSDQSLSDVLLLGYVAAGALGICLISGLLVPAQALWTTKTPPAL